MLTLALFGLLAVVIMGALFLIAVNLMPAGEQIAPSVRDEAPWELPTSRPLSAADVATIRLPVALRGYRFAETDVLLDRLGEELRARDAEIARLRGEPVVEPLDPIAGTDPVHAPGWAASAADPPAEDRPAEDRSAEDRPEPGNEDRLDAGRLAAGRMDADRPEPDRESGDPDRESGDSDRESGDSDRESGHPDRESGDPDGA